MKGGIAGLRTVGWPGHAQGQAEGRGPGEPVVKPCPICGDPPPPTARSCPGAERPRGRPRRYCSPRCAWGAEFLRRRLRRRALRVKRRVAELRRAVEEAGPLAGAVRFMDGTTSLQRLAAAVAEVAAIRKRLRDLGRGRPSQGVAPLAPGGHVASGGAP